MVWLPLQMSDFFITYRILNQQQGTENDISLERALDVARCDHISVEQWRNSWWLAGTHGFGKYGLLKKLRSRAVSKRHCY